MRKLVVLSLGLVLVPISAARGATPGPAAAADPAQTKRAKDLFAAAQKLYKQGRFEDAIARFQEAYSAKPHPVIYYNIARCYEELGKVGQARKAYKAYLSLAPQAKDRNQVADTIASLERKLRDQGLQQLTVVAEPEGAVIELDGQPAGASPATVELPIGPHRLRVTLSGFEPVERTVSLTPGQASELNVTLVKEEKRPPADAPVAGLTDGAPPPPPPLLSVGGDISSKPAAVTSRHRVWTYVVGGFAVASLGAGVGMWAGSQAQANRLINGNNGQPWQGSEPQNLYNSSQGLWVGSVVGYSVAGAAAIAAVVLFFLEPHD